MAFYGTHDTETRERMSIILKDKYASGERKPTMLKHTQEAKTKISDNNARYWLGKKKPGVGGRKPGGTRSPEEIEKFRATIKLKYDLLGRKEPLAVQIRKSLEYRLWRKAVFERDDYTCVNCGARNGEGVTVVLQADHIKPFHSHPELRLAIDNGRTLCLGCHKKTPSYGRRKAVL